MIEHFLQIYQRVRIHLHIFAFFLKGSYNRFNRGLIANYNVIEAQRQLNVFLFLEEEIAIYHVCPKSLKLHLINRLKVVLKLLR